MNRRRFLTLSAAACPVLSLRAEEQKKPLPAALEEIRVKQGVPALAGGIVRLDGLREHAVAGVRKAGGSTPVTTDDLWHLGSLTKALTATLLGTYVQEGRLKWDAKLGDLLPHLLRKATPEARSITVRNLLTHRSGLHANREQWNSLTAAGNRAEIVTLECARPLLSKPGSTYLYSNVGYMTAGVIAEKLDRQLWEKAITARLFKRLGMKAGFGGTGTRGKEDQPWPHNDKGEPMPANGVEMDNPASLGPAGTCHTSLKDYAKFVADHLCGAAGKKALLKAPLYKEMHTPPADADYAFGWQTAQRDWGGGTVLTHNGTNTMNYAVVWMAPQKEFAVIAMCNQGGPKGASACDEACSLLIERAG